MLSLILFPSPFRLGLKWGLSLYNSKTLGLRLLFCSGQFFNLPWGRQGLALGLCDYLLIHNK
jgi:hypothetical protein